jgi:hypothetical protein
MNADPVTAKLNSDVRAAKAKLLGTLRDDAVWPCVHCGHTRTHALGEPWNPNDLCEAAGMTRDSISMIALHTLAEEGRIRYDNVWMIHLPEAADAPHVQ